MNRITTAFPCKTPRSLSFLRLTTASFQDRWPLCKIALISTQQLKYCRSDRNSRRKPECEEAMWLKTVYGSVETKKMWAHIVLKVGGSEVRVRFSTLWYCVIIWYFDTSKWKCQEFAMECWHLFRKCQTLIGKQERRWDHHVTCFRLTWETRKILNKLGIWNQDTLLCTIFFIFSRYQGVIRVFRLLNRYFRSFLDSLS